MDEPLVVNLADAPARAHPGGAAIIALEPDSVRWPDTGVNVRVMQPGQPSSLYHSEPVQEDFLVLQGECTLIIDEHERRLRQWDFVHCPAGVAHVFVGAGEAPCAVLMIGSRRLDEAHYPVSESAGRYGASVASATDDPDEAYADWSEEPSQELSEAWPPG